MLESWLGFLICLFVNQNLFTSIDPPERLCASGVFHHTEEAGQAVGETAEDRAVSGGGGASPGGAPTPTHGSLL